MRTRLISSFVLFLLATAAALAATVDGKWSGEMKLPAGKKGGEGAAVALTVEFKQDGGKLTGTLKQGAGQRVQPQEIQNGKVEGDKISFETVQKTKKGDQTVTWEGSIQGDELKLKRSGRGRRNVAEVTLKKAN
jgi:hypothetical protein